MATPKLPKASKIAKENGMSMEQLTFADLVFAGWDASEAYIAAFRAGATWNKTTLENEAKKILALPNIDGYIRKKRGEEEQSKEVSVEDKDTLLSEATDKEAMLISLQRTANKLVPGSQEWRDIKKMIVDVTRMKQDEIKEEKKTVHFYLPVNYPTSCENCLLNPNNKLK